MRAIDLSPEATADAVHFERAAKEDCVLLSNDEGVERLANCWLAERRRSRA